MHTMMHSNYWNETGDRQEEYNRLWKKFVPKSGLPDDPSGIVLACAGKIMYDLFNNGGCNLASCYESYVERLESFGVDMEWLRDEVNFDGDGDYLDVDWLEDCGSDVDRMIEQALNVAIARETDASSKGIHELEWVRDRVTGEIDSLVSRLKALQSDDPEEKHWNDEGNKRLHAGWLEDYLGEVMMEALEAAQCTRKQLSEIEWNPEES